MARRGPAVERVYRVRGEAKRKAKRKAVLSQLTVLEVVLKKEAAVLATGENDSHYTERSTNDRANFVRLMTRHRQLTKENRDEF